MSLITRLKRRKAQRKGNAFIKTFKGKNENEIKQLYLDSREFANNEVVLSHLFFTYPSIISALPIDYQKKMINSNFNMFQYGSDEAKRSLVSDWLKANKFIINSRSLNLSQEEYENYVCMYFNQPEDISKLYMEDLTQILSILIKYDVKATEDIVESMKDKLTERQWDFILKADKSFIKYANQNVQKKYSEDEEFSKYISGDARDNYIKKQLEKLKDNPALLSSLTLDVQKEYINNNPHMINSIDEDILIDLLKYDISLIRFVNIPALKNKGIIYDLLENSKSKGINGIIDIFVDKGMLNAKGKLYRFDKKSNNLSYQYSNRLIKIIQSLSSDQIISLINIDVNYVLPYIVPLNSDDLSKDEKEKIILEANSRCLNLFNSYYNDEIYSKYYKSINKIYSEYLSNADLYDYTSDYKTIFDLFKILFNRTIMQSNSPEKINFYIGLQLLYKGKETDDSIKLSSEQFAGLIKNAYGIDIESGKDVYDFGSLELFDKRLSFISNELLDEFKKYNFVNVSTLLYIVKNDKDKELFAYYFEILKTIFRQTKEILFKAIENYTYYRELLEDVKDKQLTERETDNLIDILSTVGNHLNIKKKEELSTSDLLLLKKLVNDLTETKDEEIYKNLFCSYFYNKPYNSNGNIGWLEVSTLTQLCDVFDPSALANIKEDGKNIFDEQEINFFTMLKLMITANDTELLLSFIENVLNGKVKRNILPIISLFEKIKKYRVDIINSQIVTLDDIEALYASNPSAVDKKIINNVTIYTFHDQDFKILSSYSNDGIHFVCKYISELTRNCYGYSKLLKDGSVRFSTFDNSTIIKYNKDRLMTKIKPDFIVVLGDVGNDLIDVASKHSLRIININN